jgi:hypothetical protein
MKWRVIYREPKGADWQERAFTTQRDARAFQQHLLARHRRRRMPAAGAVVPDDHVEALALAAHYDRVEEVQSEGQQETAAGHPDLLLQP